MAGAGEGWYELQRYDSSDDIEVVKVTSVCVCALHPPTLPTPLFVHIYIINKLHACPLA